MAAGTKPVTKCLDAIGTACAAITALTARVYQGKKRFAEATSDENTVRALTAETQGAFFFWIENRRANGQLQIGGMVVEGVLRIYLPKDTTTDTNSAIEVAEAVCRACSLESSFTSTGAKPVACEFREEVSDEDGILEFFFQMEFELGLVC